MIANQPLKDDEKGNTMNIYFFAVREKRTSKVDIYQRYLQSVKKHPHIWGIKDGFKNAQSINTANAGDIVVVINFPENMIEYATVKSFNKNGSKISQREWDEPYWKNIFYFDASPLQTGISIAVFRKIIADLFDYTPTSLDHTSFTLVANKHKGKFPEFLKRLNIKIAIDRKRVTNTAKATSASESIGNIEGGKFDVISTKYERDSKNRTSCLKIYGYTCKICGFNFEKKYGKFGKGFIHVHHIEPLSEKGKEIVVDPERDLIPVCCNCHAMIHHKNPALKPKEIERIYKQSNSTRISLCSTR